MMICLVSLSRWIQVGVQKLSAMYCISYRASKLKLTQVCALIRASLWCKDKSFLTVFDVMQHSTEEHKRKEHPDYGAVNVTVAVLMSVLSIFLMLQASPHWGNIYTEMQINAVSSSRRVLTVGGAITATGPA